MTCNNCRSLVALVIIDGGLLLIGCFNRFVKIEYISTTFTIICAFKNPLDTSEKSCSVQYWRCDQILTNTNVISASTSSSNISLSLNRLSVSGDAPYCYNVTASNSSFVVIIEGMLGILLCSAYLYSVSLHIGLISRNAI